MSAVRRFLNLAKAQYGLSPSDLWDHKCARGLIACLNEPERSMRCPCVGRGRRQLARWAEKLGERPVPASTAYAVFCVINAAKRAIAWREKHDPGEDEWGWKMHRRYLRGASYAGPEPRIVPALGPPVAIPKHAQTTLARELAAALCVEKSHFPKSKLETLENDIARFLRRRHATYTEAFLTALLNIPFSIVVRERFEDVPGVFRTGPKTSEVQIIKNRLPSEYEVWWTQMAPAGDRPAEPWEVVQALLTRTWDEMQREANENAKRRANVQTPR